MSLRKLLDHECDIRRLEVKAPIMDGRVPIDQPSKPEKPPLYEKVPCHFEEVQQQVVTGQPQTTILQRMRVTFLPDADVQINDIAIWDGVEYKLEKPKSVRGHHIIVMARRSDAL